MMQIAPRGAAKVHEDIKDVQVMQRSLSQQMQAMMAAIKEMQPSRSNDHRLPVANGLRRIGGPAPACPPFPDQLALGDGAWVLPSDSKTPRNGKDCGKDDPDCLPGVMDIDDQMTEWRSSRTEESFSCTNTKSRSRSPSPSKPAMPMFSLKAEPLPPEAAPSRLCSKQSDDPRGGSKLAVSIAFEATTPTNESFLKRSLRRLSSRLTSGEDELGDDTRSTLWRMFVSGGRKGSFDPDMTFDLKEKVKRTLTVDQYSVEVYYKSRGLWQHIARSQWFENLTLFIISGNALWLWIDSDYNRAASLLEADFIFQLVENAFCVYFTIELLIRFMAFKKKRNCFRDAWFVFDSFLVITMVLETWVLTGIILMTGVSLASGGNSGILRLARLLRLSRMCRMARLVRAVPELAILIKGMMASMRSVVTTLFLLLIVMYIFAIAFTQLTDGTDVGVDAVGVSLFTSVGRSMYSLWLYGVLSLDFAEGIVNDLGPAAGIMYYVFVLLAPYTIMNMLIGVLCEVVSAVASSEKEANLIFYAKDQLESIMVAMDINGDRCISKSEFHQLLEYKEACLILNDLDIDVAGLVDFADVIFEPAAGHDVNDVRLEFEELIETLMQFRGSSNATVKDIVELRKLIRNMFPPSLLEKLSGGHLDDRCRRAMSKNRTMTLGRLSSRMSTRHLT